MCLQSAGDSPVMAEAAGCLGFSLYKVFHPKYFHSMVVSVSQENKKVQDLSRLKVERPITTLPCILLVKASHKDSLLARGAKSLCRRVCIQ